MNEKKAKEPDGAIGEEQGEKKPEKIKREPIVKSRVGRTVIWIGVLLLAGAAVSTRSLILVILAVLAPGIAGILTL